MRNFILCFATVLIISGCTQEQSNFLSKSDLNNRVFFGPGNKYYRFYRDTAYCVDLPPDGLSGMGFWDSDTLYVTNTRVPGRGSEFKILFDKNYVAHIENLWDFRNDDWFPYKDRYPNIDPMFELKDTAVGGIEGNSVFEKLTSQPWIGYFSKIRVEMDIERESYYFAIEPFEDTFNETQRFYFGVTKDSIGKMIIKEDVEKFKVNPIESDNSFQMTFNGKSSNWQIIEVFDSFLVVKLGEDETFLGYVLLQPMRYFHLDDERFVVINHNWN
jgi:hypothetical protein